VRRFLAWFPRFRQVPQWYIDGRVQDGVRMPADVWRETLAGLVTARPPTDTAMITAPTLIVWGARDELLTLEDQQALAAIPASRLIVYQDTGHLVLWEQPERVASDLTAFVDSLRWQPL
jgi:pimeloyl-ACP methyl ester carboxylesterase